LVRLLYPETEVVEGNGIAHFHIELRRPRNPRRWWKPQIRFLLEGSSIFEPYPLNHALPLLEWGLNWCIAIRSHRFLMLHAGVVERGNRALILPASPGSGKSTLTAALASRGWRFLSDEFGLVDPQRCDVLPLPRAIALKNESIAVIRDYAPELFLGPVFPKTRKGTVSHVRPPGDSLRRQRETAAPTWIVFPRFHRGASTTIKQLPPGAAFNRLAHNAFNYRLLGETAFLTLESLVRRCRCFSLAFGDLDSACAALDAIESE
jgi:HprK-related kinase A